MKEYEKIERYVNDLLTVMGIDKDGEEQLLWLFLHHACCAAAIYEVLGDDMKPVYTEMLKKLNYFFSSKISLKQRKRRKEKENFPPYPLLKGKVKQEKGEKNIYTHTAVGETGIVFSDLDQRKEAFKMECWARRNDYDRKMLANFFNYWSDVNPKTHKILLTSIPRDTVIHMNEKGGASDKLTHTGIYGIGCSLGAVEDLTGLDMNYYVKVNYTTVEKMVDALGGIDVKSDFEFDTHGMKAKYHFKKGMNHLDGKHALAFARERKSFPDGDIQRNRNQAKVMAAMLKKATSSRTILMNYTTILNSIKDYMQINMKQKEIKSLVKMQIAKNPKWQIKRQSMEGPSTFMQCYSTGSYQVSVVQVSEDSLKKCVKRIRRVMEPPEEE